MGKTVEGYVGGPIGESIDAPAAIGSLVAKSVGGWLVTPLVVPLVASLVNPLVALLAVQSMNR